jgi:lipopolysaccharide export system protein LptA
MTFRTLGRAVGLAAALAALGLSSAWAAPAATTASTTTAPAAPVTPGTALDAGNVSGPVEIDAEEGIEWRRDEKVYIARGHAKAKRGDITLYADTLTAHYDDSGGGSKVTRVVAEGAVKIATPTQTVLGDRADYDLGQGVMVITGKDLRATTPTQTLTATDRFEYWAKREIVVARGNAVIIEPGKKVTADVITGYFVATPEGKRELKQVEANGRVVIIDKTEVVHGQKAIYDLKRGIATLTGGVKITRGKNQLNGEYAEVNLNTGVSRLLGAPKGKGDGRVHTLLVPDQNGSDSLLGGTPAKPAAAKPTTKKAP